MKKSCSLLILMLLAIFSASIVATAESVASNSLPATASPYSANFDLRNMAGINDNTITADAIEAFIREKTPNSPLMDEAGIGSCFMDAGLKNNVSPVFLVATAYLESGFGTVGWSKLYPESHNALDYAVYFGNESPNQNNSAGSWCAMVRRVAAIIANGNKYYKQDLFTILQVSAKYPGNLDSDTIASLMNELYSFSANRKSSYATLPANSIAKGSTDVDSWMRKCQDLDIQDKYAEAIQCYEKAIEMSPEDAIAWYKKGDDLNSQGLWSGDASKYEEAVEAYNKAIEIDPQYAYVWYHKGISLNNQGKYDEAVKAFDKAIGLNKQYKSALDSKGCALNILGKYAEAIVAFDEGLEINADSIIAPDGEIEVQQEDSIIWYHKGVALKALGHLVEANAAFANAKKLGFSPPTSYSSVDAEWAARGTGKMGRG